MNTEGMSIEKMRAIVLVATLRAQELLTGGYRTRQEVVDIVGEDVVKIATNTLIKCYGNDWREMIWKPLDELARKRCK